MSETVGGFCRDPREELEQGRPLAPEAVAGHFVALFGVSVRPTLAELTDLAHGAGFGTVQDGRMEGLRSAHIGQPGASTTSTTGTTCGRVPRRRRWPTKCTRSS
jgi:hypothetical protein